MQSPLKFLRSYFPPFFLTVSLLGVYLGTLAPGLTWANGGSDGGDLITAAATGGIPHPTGYPLFLVLARLFQLLPLGSLAFRTNLMSAIATALGALLIYLVVAGQSQNSRLPHAWGAGLAAGIAFGLAPLVWSQAVITEVYALQSFLVALVLYLYSRPVQPNDPSARIRSDRSRGLALGLAAGNQMTSLFLVPLALWLGSIPGRAAPEEAASPAGKWGGYSRLDRHALYRQLAWFGAGLSVYLTLPLKALAGPPVNWGNPHTLERFWWLVSGGVYKSYYLQTNLPDLWGRLQAGAALLLQQFGFLGLLAGLAGLVLFFKPTPLYILSGWTALAFLGFSLFYGSVDSYVNLIPMFIAFAVWIGLGTAGLTGRLSQRLPRWGWALGLALLAAFGLRSLAVWVQVDASRDGRAEAFGGEVLASLPQNALVFAKGDQAVFALWYFHFALGERPDLTVFATDLLHFDWYQETLQVTYPALVVPGPFPWPETIVRANPTRAICYVQYSGHPEMDCSKPTASP